MVFELSDEAIQRASYPWERYWQGSGGKHADLLSALRAEAAGHAAVESRIDVLEARLDRRNAAAAESPPPPWAAFLADLTASLGEDMPPAIQTFRSGAEARWKGDAYARPFLSAATQFAASVLPAVRQSTSPETLHCVLDSAADWYKQRSVETARFVLHLDQARSGLGYLAWLGRFDSAAATAESPWGSIATEYPVLLRWLSRIFRTTREAVQETLHRLEADRESIERRFGIARSDPLADLAPGLSDPHRGGRSVMRLVFEGGASLIYKPKPLDVDGALMSWVADHRDESGVLPLQVLPCADYGWVEDAGTNLHSGDIRRSPRSIGRASAMFWLLNATDLHADNVAADDRGVHALDLETLFRGGLPQSTARNEPSWRSHSVFGTLLFDYTFGEKQKPNVSGFCASPGVIELGPRVEFLVQGDTVLIESGSAMAPQPRESGRSEYDGEVEALLDGFRSAMRGTLRTSLRSFVLALDKACPLRLVVRDTFFYARILERMRQPRNLRDSIVQYADLLSLHVGAAEAMTSNDHVHEIVDAEIAQLLAGDIPYFSCGVGSRDLNLGSKQLAGFFLVSGKERAIDKLSGVEQSDLEEQVALMRVALSRYSPAKINLEQGGRAPRSLADHTASLARTIVRSAFQPRGEPARWFSMFGDVAGFESRVDIGDSSFFSGAWGILLSLQAVLSSLGPEHRDSRELADFLDRQAALWSEGSGEVNVESVTPRLLGYSGIGGDVFAQSTLLALDQRRWHFLAEQVVETLVEAEPRIENDRTLDVIGGVAGLILGCERFLVAEPRGRGSAVARRVMERCGAHLINRAHLSHGRITWTIPGEEVPLLGYAHGWAGIVAALGVAHARLEDIEKVARLEWCLRSASMFPAHLLESGVGWHDFRSSPDGHVALNRSWCNGSPGLLRGLLRVEEYWTEPVRREASRLLESVLIQLGSTQVHRYCCGELGNADLLLDLSRSKRGGWEPILRDATVVTTKAIVEAGRATPDVLPELLFPGLFHGTSGMAYAGARFLMPELPSLCGQPQEHCRTELGGGRPIP